MIIIDQMILEIGIVNDPERVGYYSGLLESIFAFTSFICSKSVALWLRVPFKLMSYKLSHALRYLNILGESQ